MIYLAATETEAERWLIFVILLVLGCWHILSPDTAFRARRLGKFVFPLSEIEPDSLDLILTRTLGIILTIAALIMLLSLLKVW